MPTYEYECTKCGHTFERFQSMMEEPVKRCPECRCKVRRIVSGGAGFIFKGSGFYETDYRSDHYRKREKEDKKAATTPDKKTDKKETKKKETKKEKKKE